MKRFIGSCAAALCVVTAGVAHAGTGRQIWLTNSCPNPVRLYMRWVDPVRGPLISGSWDFKASERDIKMLEGGSNAPVVIDDSSTIYIYAESTNGTSKYWQGSYNYVFKNVTYAMMSVPVSVKDGHFQLELTCPSTTTYTPPAPTNNGGVSQHP